MQKHRQILISVLLLEDIHNSNSKLFLTYSKWAPRQQGPFFGTHFCLKIKLFSKAAVPECGNGMQCFVFLLYMDFQNEDLKAMIYNQIFLRVFWPQSPLSSNVWVGTLPLSNPFNIWFVSLKKKFI